MLVEQRIQAAERTYQRFGINPTFRGPGRKDLLSGLLGNQQTYHHKNRDDNNQNLPAQFFYHIETKKGLPPDRPAFGQGQVKRPFDKLKRGISF